MKRIEGEAPVFGKLEVTRMAQALSAHAGARQAIVAQNVAQADTPGYRAQDLTPFAETFAADAPGLRITRAGHLSQALSAGGRAVEASPGALSPNGNSVSLEAEMVRAVDVRLQHDMALSVYRSVSDIVRASLGRPR